MGGERQTRASSFIISEASSLRFCIDVALDLVALVIVSIACVGCMQGFASMEDTVFCGVFDGHGPYGHLVAKRVRDSLPSKLFHYWEQQQTLVKEGHRSQEEEQPLKSMQNGGLLMLQQNLQQPQTGGRQADAPPQEDMVQGGGALPLQQQGSSRPEPSIFGAWKESHLMAYRVMDQELFSHQNLDCFCSGTTTVTVLKQVGWDVNFLHYFAPDDDPYIIFPIKFCIELQSFCIELWRCFRLLVFFSPVQMQQNLNVYLQVVFFSCTNAAKAECQPLGFVAVYMHLCYSKLTE